LNFSDFGTQAGVASVLGVEWLLRLCAQTGLADDDVVANGEAKAFAPA